MQTMPLHRNAVRNVNRSVIADNCLACGLCDTYRGHVCGKKNRIREEYFPACGKTPNGRAGWWSAIRAIRD
jgi:hypothetical protein